MTDLELLQCTPVPRPSDLCRRYARKIDSIFGFIAYGLLWFFVSCLFATAGLFLGIAIVGDGPSVVGMVFVAAMWITGFVGAWVLFALWVRRRIGPARRLFRDGTFAEATVGSVHHLSMRGAPFTRAVLAVGDRRIGLSMGGHPRELHEGATITVLVVPDYGYCATFPIAGRLIAASIE
ncbi:MAG TPA: hypothetical protein VG755_25420 [Nannocystaceae bacterium]|nr:hypothetical protein [Nannocystaceae bacterium]